MAVRSTLFLLQVAATSGHQHGTAHNPKPLVVGQTFLANGMDPTDGGTGWALASHGIAEKLFTVNDQGAIVGQLAKSVNKLDADGKSWEITLNDNKKFSDGTAVTAALVAQALTLQNTNHSNGGARASLGTMTVTAPAVDRVKIDSEKATPVMESVLAEWCFPIFLLKNNQFLYTGQYAVEKFVAGSHIDLIPNTHYPRATERPLAVIKKFKDGAALSETFATGSLDMAFHLPVNDLTKLRENSNITIRSTLVGYHYMMFHNMKRPALSDLKVRKAVDIAIDRTELTQETRGGRATRSFFPEGTPYHLADSGLGSLNGDKTGAEALLDEAGWVKDAGTGSRMKDGEKLTLKVVAYPQRPGLPLMLPVVNRTLRSLGITVEAIVTSGANWDELDAIMASRDWDLLMWAQHTLPAGDSAWFTSNFFRSDAGNNQAKLNSSSVDGLIDALSSAATGSPRKAASDAAQKAILDLVPVSMLQTPSWHVGFYGKRLEGYPLWGSDYYVIHSEFGLHNAPGASQNTTAATPVSDTPAANNSASGSSESVSAAVSTHALKGLAATMSLLIFWCLA